MGFKAGANAVELRQIRRLYAGDPANGLDPVTPEVISKMMKIKLENVNALLDVKPKRGRPVGSKTKKKVEAPKVEVETPTEAA